MKRFIIREDEIKSMQKTLHICLHASDTGLCTLSPYMPSHLDLGNADCCGIFNAIDDENIVICNECEESINDALRELKEKKDAGKI